VPGRRLSNTVLEVKDIVEKPAPAAAPSRLVSVSGYILTPDFLSYIDRTSPDTSGEVGVAHVLQVYAKEKPVVGVKINGSYYDCGSKPGYLRAIVDAAKRQGISI
jgi:UTP--glucose-1-phosphate uridylyltransferase